MKTVMDVAGRGPAVAQRKTSAPSRSMVRATGGRAAAADRGLDERMRMALAERASGPVQMQPRVSSGYEDLIAAARASAPTRMPGPVQRKMESALNADFSDVRVHPGSERAVALGAQAFTQGNDIHMAPGQWAPDTTRGQELLGHELGHVLQQRSGRAKPTSQVAGVSINDDPALEAEADAMGGSAARAGVTAPTARPCPSCASTAGAPVQRKLRVAGSDLDPAGVKHLTTDVVTTKLADIVPSVVGADLVRETLREMQAVSEVLDFADADAVAADVRHRVLVSHYMRLSQGSTTTRKAFSYPDRKGDGTAGVAAKVNDDAAAYWGPRQGDYYFDLSPAGLANPYQALITLFTEHTDPKKRTLIHCDYVVSMLEFRAYAENIGVARFNFLVASGALSMRLKWNGFAELLEQPALKIIGPFSLPLAPTAPLKEITVASKGDLIIGDHVKFYNHPSYDTLIDGVGGIWRLENAIVIDRVGGQFRYQGHGYFSPVTEDVLLAGMIRQYNLHIDEALGIIHRTAHGTAADKATASAELTTKYPNVKRKADGSGWEVRGEGFCAGSFVVRDLKHLTAAEAPGLVHPCFGAIKLRRPVESVP